MCISDSESSNFAALRPEFKLSCLWMSKGYAVTIQMEKCVHQKHIY